MIDLKQEAYTFIPGLGKLVEEIQSDSITSRTFYKGIGMNAILFAFDAGQELSEHTSTKTAILQIVEGEAIITLGEDRHELSAGAWVHLSPNLKHSVYAKTPMKMLLLMFESAKPETGDK